MSNDIYMTRNKATEIQFDSQQIEILLVVEFALFSLNRNKPAPYISQMFRCNNKCTRAK